MYQITRAYRDPVAGIREAAVIPLTDIKRGLYLYPVFWPRSATGMDVQ